MRFIYNCFSLFISSFTFTYFSSYLLWTPNGSSLACDISTSFCGLFLLLLLGFLYLFVCWVFCILLDCSQLYSLFFVLIIPGCHWMSMVYFTLGRMSLSISMSWDLTTWSMITFLPSHVFCFYFLPLYF